MFYNMLDIMLDIIYYIIKDIILYNINIKVSV
jgi:hypothetical protein